MSSKFRKRVIFLPKIREIYILKKMGVFSQFLNKGNSKVLSYTCMNHNGSKRYIYFCSSCYI